jgi:hypothetical protein
MVFPAGRRRIHDNETSEPMERTGTFPDPQTEVIDKYCSEARALIERAHDRDEALTIMERECARFAEECGSSLVLAATRQYIGKLIQQKW